MQDEKKDSGRRHDERLNLSLQISLPNQSGKTLNISASGVYFEVVTDDINCFSPGTTIPIQITAEIDTAGADKRNLKLQGNGLVIRNEIKDVTNRGNRLGVAVEFNDKLDVLADKS